MTPTHQAPPTLTVYVHADTVTNLAVCRWDHIDNDWQPIKYVERKDAPDPSYINAIINDASSSEDKIQRLQKYLQTFDSLTKY